MALAVAALALGVVLWLPGSCMAASTSLPAKEGTEQGPSAQFSAGLAEAVIRTEYDPVDVVTEVINRAEHALSQAMSQGPGKIVALGPAALAAGAVA